MVSWRHCFCHGGLLHTSVGSAQGTYTIKTVSKLRRGRLLFAFFFLQALVRVVKLAFNYCRGKVHVRVNLQIKKSSFVRFHFYSEWTTYVRNCSFVVKTGVTHWWPLLKIVKIFASLFWFKLDKDIVVFIDNPKENWRRVWIAFLMTYIYQLFVFSRSSSWFCAHLV